MSRINRRQFLATGAVGSAGLAWAGQNKPLAQPWNAGKSRSLKKALDPVATVCVACGAHCPILAYRDQGRVVQVEPNPAAGAEASICARAYQQVEALYDAERVLTPLARTGERGQGGWEAITWDEALTRIRSQLAAAPQDAWVEMGRPDPLALELLSSLGVTQVAGARSRQEQLTRGAQQEIYGAPLARPNLTDVRTVLLVGTRPWDNGAAFAPLAKELARVKVDGAEVVSLSTYQGATGSVASRWIPIRPGSEAAVLCGLAHLALQDQGVDAAALAERVNTDLDTLRTQLAPYTPQRVADVSGVAPDTLAELARRWVGRTPGVCLAETPEATAAVPVQAATALLNALAGTPYGATAGVRAAKAHGAVPASAPEGARDDATRALLAGASVPLYLAYRANPVYRGTPELAEALSDPRRVGLSVCMDTHLTETAQLADLVLPAATDLELWNLFGDCALGGDAVVSLQQPAARAASETAWLRAHQTRPAVLFDGPGNGPQGDARQLGDVLLALAGPEGSPERNMVAHASVAAAVQAKAEALGLPGADGLRRQAPAAQQACWFPTPSRKLEIDGTLGGKEPAAATAAVDGHPFTLVVLDHPELDPAYANTAWGREARRTNPLYINTRVARELGLAAGTTVVVAGAGGEVRARLQPVDGIHPEAVALAGDFGHWAGGARATAGTRSPALPQPARRASRRELLANPLGIAPVPAAPAPIPWWHGGGGGVRVAVLGDGGAGHGALRVAVRPA